MSHCQQASAGISAAFDTDDCGRGEMLFPSHSTQEKLSTSLSSHNGKIPPYFNMPWAPPFKAEAAFHSNCLNLTNTVAMIQCFPYAGMLMKRIDRRCGCGSLASPQTPCSALLRTRGQVIKAGDRPLCPACLFTLVQHLPWSWSYPVLLSADRMETFLCWLLFPPSKTLKFDISSLFLKKFTHSVEYLRLSGTPRQNKI